MTRIGAPARPVLVELNGMPSPVDWAAAPLWRVIATADGVPCWAAWIPGPGRLVDPGAFTQATLADAREHARELALAERFERLLGIAEVTGPARTVSVVVCTHRRPTYLSGLLDALTRLDPPPHEVIVVDNDPGEGGCEELLAAHGARYVREDRRGLDRARTAGLRAATGELVAFTDDDCVPAPGWLARLDRHFADPTVHGVTGPAFAWEFETPSQLRFELEGGFGRGFRLRRFDWMTHPPCGSGAVGSGANMIFRRAVLLGLGDPFPPELDAGTATQTGGDMYAIYRVLEAGGRMVFDPGTYVFHRHRRDPAALRRAFRGYGTGIVATMWKVLLERREPEALVTAYWLWQQYRCALLHRFAGYTDPRSLRVAADYLGGAPAGIGAWYAAVREAGDEAAPIAPIAPIAPVAMPSADAAASEPAPAMSVVIPTVGRPSALGRCLAALPSPGPTLEIIVVDDRPAGSPGGLVAGAMPPGVRTLRSGGSGAAGARNAGARAATGEVLVFLDDDLVPAPGLIDRHRAAHTGATDVFAVGYSPPRPAQDTWVARAASLWWEDHFAAMARRERLWATDLLSGNVSLRRERFLALGGFSERFGRLRREDWLFGAMVLAAGVAVRYLPDAVAYHEYTLSTGRRLAAAREEGWGDALLVDLHPELAGAVDVMPAPLNGGMATVVQHVVGSPRTIAATTWALDCLERARLRSAWLTLFARAQRLLYANGLHKGAQALAGGGQAQPPAPPVPMALGPAVEIPLATSGAVARPLVVPGPGWTRRVSADRGRWTAATASRAARLVAAAGTLRERLPVPATAGLRVALVSSPAHWGPPGPPRAAAAGPELHVHDEADLWPAAAALLGAGDYDAVWVAVPGTRLAAGVSEELLAHSDGDAVAVTVAAAGPCSEAPSAPRPAASRTVADRVRPARDDRDPRDRRRTTRGARPGRRTRRGPGPRTVRARATGRRDRGHCRSHPGHPRAHAPSALARSRVAAPAGPRRARCPRPRRTDRAGRRARGGTDRARRDPPSRRRALGSRRPGRLHPWVRRRHAGRRAVSEVTVVVAAFDAARTLDATLASLRAQTYQDWEAVVVDDGSADQTGELAARHAAADPRIRVLQRPHAGVSAARNAGIAAACTRWLLFLDADDQLAHEALAAFLQTAAEHPDADLVHAGWTSVPDHGDPVNHRFVRYAGEDSAFAAASTRCPFASHAAIVRTSLVREVGAFDPTLQVCEDWDLWLRVARTTARFRSREGQLALYRTRARSASADGRRMLADGLRVIDRAHAPDPRVANPAPVHADGAPPAQRGAVRLAFACHAAGLVVGTGEDAVDLLRQVADTTAAGAFDPRAVAAALYAAVPLASGATAAAWWSLPAPVHAALDAFLAALECMVEVPGAELQVRRVLEEYALGQAPASAGAVNVTLGRTWARTVDLDLPLADVVLPAGVDRLRCLPRWRGRTLSAVTLPAADGGAAGVRPARRLRGAQRVGPARSAPGPGWYPR